MEIPWGYVFKKLLEFVPPTQVSPELDLAKIVFAKGELTNGGFVVSAFMPSSNRFTVGIEEYKGSLFNEIDQPVCLGQPHRRFYSRVIAIKEGVARALYWAAVDRLLAE